MYGSRFWLWLSTGPRLVDDVARLERALAEEREAALARRLPEDLAAEADAAVAGRGAGSVVDDLRTAAAMVRAGLTAAPGAEVTDPWADWLDDHSAEHAGRECMFAPDVCPAARTARALMAGMAATKGSR